MCLNIDASRRGPTHRKFLNDTGGALEWLFLEGEHRVVALIGVRLACVVHVPVVQGFAHVESRQLLSVTIEGLVVEVHKLFC